MKKNNFSIIGTVVFILLTFLIASPDLIAQCPMCKAAAEQNLANGGTAAKGLNKGILYLLATPYMLAIVIGGLWWYKNHRSPEVNNV